MITLAFMNNLTWKKDLVKNVYDRLNKGCHIITSQALPQCKILKEEFLVDASWGTKLKLYYYIK